MAPLKVDIVGIDTLGDAEWAEWRVMLAANPALSSPYFRPEFARIAVARIGHWASEAAPPEDRS